MLRYRVLTAIVAVPLLILYISKGTPFMFALLIGVVSIISLQEYFRIVFNPSGQPDPLMPPLGYLSCVGVLCGTHLKSPEIVTGVLIFHLIIGATRAVLSYQAGSPVLNILSRQVCGLIYVPLFLSSLVLLRNGEKGALWIFFLLLTVAAGDTGAYFSGTYFGKHKLAPQVSPGKTVEGLIGALLCIQILGGAYRYYFLPELSWVTGTILLLVLGVTGVVGDLFESALKREGNIKDSGKILPGHGGMLDRIDGLLFAGPLLYYFKLSFLG